MYTVSEIHEMGNAQNLILFEPAKNVFGLEDTELLHYEPQNNFDE